MDIKDYFGKSNQKNIIDYFNLKIKNNSDSNMNTGIKTNVSKSKITIINDSNSNLNNNSNSNINSNINSNSNSNSNNKKYLLRFDGASKGNPGEAGAGAVLYEDNKEIWTISRYLGKQTNNYAECFAMVLGIEEAHSRGICNLKVEGDSMLIINQLNRKWKINNKDLKILHLSIAKSLKSFDTITFNHIYRKYNTRADELANLSLNNHIV